MRNLLRDPFYRFLLAGGAALFVSLTWPAMLFFECWNCADRAWEWTLQEVTFSIVHPVFFSTAIGFFVANFSSNNCLPSAIKGRLLAISALAALCLLMVLISYSDLTSGSLSSYELLDPCTSIKKDKVTLDLRKKMDSAKADLKAAEESKTATPAKIAEQQKAFDSAEKEHKTNRDSRLAARAKSGLFGTLAKANWITVVNILLTLMFELFSVIVVWYFVMAIWNRKIDEVRSPFIATVLLLTVWIPARAYANFCENEMGGSGNDGPVVFAAIVVLIVLGALFCQAVIDGIITLDTAKCVIGAAIARIITSATMILT